MLVTNTALSPSPLSLSPPISPHLSPSLPISPHLSPSLPISPHLSPSLSISPSPPLPLSPSLPLSLSPSLPLSLSPSLSLSLPLHLSLFHNDCPYGVNNAEYTKSCSHCSNRVNTPYPCSVNLPFSHTLVCPSRVSSVYWVHHTLGCPNSFAIHPRSITLTRLTRMSRRMLLDVTC